MGLRFSDRKGKAIGYAAAPSLVQHQQDETATTLTITARTTGISVTISRLVRRETPRTESAAPADATEE